MAYRIGRAFPQVLSSSRAPRRPAAGRSDATCGFPHRRWPSATWRGSRTRARRARRRARGHRGALLDGRGARARRRLMCTASHNPKAYTGAKLVRAGLALSGDSGIAELRRDAGRRSRPARPTSRRDRARGRRGRLPARRPSATSTRRASAASRRRRRRQRDGGPMVGPLLDLPIEQVRTYWSPRQVPGPRAEPAAPGEPPLHRRQGAVEGAELGIAWDGDADRCFFIDDTGEFVAGDFLTALLAESILREAGRARSSTTCAPRARSTTWSSARAEPPLVNRVGHAFFKSRMRETEAAFGGEVSGHYYFRDFYCADSGTIPALSSSSCCRSPATASASSCGRCASATSSPVRSTPRSTTRAQRCVHSLSVTGTAG